MAGKRFQSRLITLMCHFERGAGVETCFNYTDTQTAFVSSDERKWITKIRKLKQERPDEVRIIREPEDNNGCIYATIPPAWVKIRPKRMMTEEKRAELSEKMKRISTVFSEQREFSANFLQEGVSECSDEYLSI